MTQMNVGKMITKEETNNISNLKKDGHIIMMIKGKEKMQRSVRNQVVTISFFLLSTLAASMTLQTRIT